jgi:DNA-binding CsgD family transcriptional regulator
MGTPAAVLPQANHKIAGMNFEAPVNSRGWGDGSIFVTLIACADPRASYLSGVCRLWGAYRLMRPLDLNELSALKLFANGKTADEMAAELGVSKSMAQHYLRVAARKLGARNRVHAVAIAVRNGLIKSSGGGS